MKIWIEVAPALSGKKCFWIHLTEPDWAAKYFESDSSPLEVSDEREEKSIRKLIGETGENELIECNVTSTGKRWVPPED